KLLGCRGRESTRTARRWRPWGSSARFGDTLGYGAAGNRSRVQRLRRADLLAAPRVAFLSLFVGRLQVDPIRATGDSLAGLCFDIGAYCLGPNSPICQDLRDFEDVLVGPNLDLFDPVRPVYLWKS
ncbi:unnamed protein product, partial [Effrenium voratum]